ncbi:MAG: phosphotransferase enzyme family protein [Bacillota bacterium]
MATTNLFPVQDSVLSDQAIAERILPLYGLTQPVSCRFFRKGICDTYQIQSADGVYYMKVYRAGRRSSLDVSEEVRLLNHLLEQGVSVVRPAARLDGGYVNELQAPEGSRYAVLFDAVKGEGEKIDQHRREFGVAVARMHRAADTMTPPYDRQPLDMDALIEENMVPIGRLMARRPEDLRIIREIADRAKDRIVSLLPTASPEYGVCHGDLHGGDVLYAPDGSPTLLDFDSSGIGWRAVDLGVYLCHDWMNTSVEAEAERQRKLALLLDGYQSVRTLSAVELEVIQLTPAIRHIFLMGHVLRHTTSHQGWNWANDGFVDWHMKWFRHWHENRMN